MGVDRDQRRNLNSDERYAFGFTDMQYFADEDGWPYPDDDDEETTENRAVSIFGHGRANWARWG
jgi:hypothetical protein